MLNTCVEWILKDVERWKRGKRVEIAVDVHSCSLWEMVLSAGLHNSSWTITLSWKIQSHMNTEEVLEPISIDTQFMLKHQQRNDVIFFSISTLEQLRIISFFLLCLNKPNITGCESASDYVKIYSECLNIQMLCCSRGERHSWTCPWKSCHNPERKKTPTHNAVLIGA